MESILNSTKKLLGINPEYDCFDQDLVIHINSVFMILNQLGVGPKNGFSIIDETSTWNDFIGDNSEIDAVKTYVYQKVKLIFDPPASSVAAESLKQLISEFEWRLLVSTNE